MSKKVCTIWLPTSIKKRENAPIAILADLAGPKIRIGEFKNKTIILKAGSTFILTTRKLEGTESIVSINYSNLPSEVDIGQIILINDGKVSMKIKKIAGNEIICKVIDGGELAGKKGLNIPQANLTLSSLTKKDVSDVKFAIANDVDFIALSFVRKARDIKELKKLIGKNDIQVIAKIETKEAVENIDEIIAESDGVMIARGDLAVEMPLEEIPMLQKMIIKKCNKAAKPVITATQMLSSMVNSLFPTRAEVNDIANAILDGTDAIMLSEETAIGKYPIETVKVMAKVAISTEKNFPYEEALKLKYHESKDIGASIGYSVVSTAHDLHAKLILALSARGMTARMISRYKPNRPIIVATDRIKTYRRMALSFNCYPILQKQGRDVFELMKEAMDNLLKNKLANKGELIVVAAGIPLAEPGNTNTMMVKKI